MKKTKLALVAFAISTGMLFSFNAFQSSTIKGTVTPADKAIKAWAMSSTDTLSVNVLNGAFEFKDVKAGTYSVIVEAQAPYATTRRNDVVVAAGTPVTDIGEIKLQYK
jgi:hypothetical protein